MDIKKKSDGVGRMWIHALVMAMIGCLWLTSCGPEDDDDNPGITYPVELIGAWQGETRLESVTDEKGLGTTGQLTEVAIEDERIVINPNGTLVGYGQLNDGSWRESSRDFWIYSDGKLLLSGRKGDVVYKILTLDNVELSMSHTEQFTDDDGRKFTRTITSRYSRLTEE